MLNSANLIEYCFTKLKHREQQCTRYLYMYIFNYRYCKYKSDCIIVNPISKQQRAFQPEYQ